MPNGRVELLIGPAGPMGWRASFPRFRVGGAPGLLATETENVIFNVSYGILTDERKRRPNAGNQTLQSYGRRTDIRCMSSGQDIVVSFYVFYLREINCRACAVTEFRCRNSTTVLRQHASLR